MKIQSHYSNWWITGKYKALRFFTGCVIILCLTNSRLLHSMQLHVKDAEVDQRRLLAADKTGGTPLHIAAANGNSALCDSLLQNGADVNAKNSLGETALLSAAASTSNTVEACKLLLSKGARVYEKNNNADTALLLAAYKDDDRLVELLLEHGADPFVLNEKKETPCMIAIINGNSWICGIYLSRGLIDVSKRDSNGITLLGKAASYGHRHVCELFLNEMLLCPAMYSDLPGTPATFSESEKAEVLKAILEKNNDVVAGGNLNKIRMYIAEAQAITTHPELKEYLGPNCLEEFREAVRDLVASLNK